MSGSRARNVVLIVFDYMGYGDIEPFGESEIRTPNIRALAEQGRCYTDFYAPAPICVPSRAAMMTGRYPRHLGMERNINRGEAGLPVAEKTLARYFKDAGYRTALFGKWHLGYEVEDGPNAHGFDAFVGFHDWNIDYYSHKTRTGVDALYRGTEVIDRPGYTTDLFTDDSVAFIESAGADDAPFLLYLAYNAALPPYSPPGREADIDSHDTWKDGGRADYVAAIEHLDLSVGRVLDTLEAKGLGEDTLVLLTYDHGGTELATKGPFFHGFGTLWEGGIRVPMILRCPDLVPAGGIGRAWYPDGYRPDATGGSGHRAGPADGRGEPACRRGRRFRAADVFLADRSADRPRGLGRPITARPAPRALEVSLGWRL